MIKVFDAADIILESGFRLGSGELQESVEEVNMKFVQLQDKTENMAVDIFSAIDFRMLSGLVGETLVTNLDSRIRGLRKNPNIDGYPDLLDVSQKVSEDKAVYWAQEKPDEFIKYPFGGLEVKNTFGTKKSKSDLAPGETRIERINAKPDWKAHHQYTNNLLAVFSDFVAACPQIVAVMYSDQLVEDDWSAKQNPKLGSTMTSFTVLKSSGWQKLRRRVVLCKEHPAYMEFFGVGS